MNKKKITTPVLFLVFNRPDKTQRVFDVIKKAQPQKLYIASDGARPNVTSDLENCIKVRKIVQEIDWECDVKYLFHSENLGCSLSGKTAWDWIFSQEKEMIFIEDDGLLSLSFFLFAQELLEKYRYNEKIAYISSENFDMNYDLPSSYFFSRFGGGTYAMATWKRVYDLYEYKIDSFPEVKKRREYKKSFINKFDYDYTNEKFKNYMNCGGNTYDLQMAYLLHKHNMLNIIPNINMCSNIGFDIDGSNTPVNPGGEIALKFGNRPRFELSNIIHPEKVNKNDKFERKYFRVRVLYGESILLSTLRFYLMPYLSPIYRILIKMPISYIRSK